MKLTFSLNEKKSSKKYWDPGTQYVIKEMKPNAQYETKSDVQ